MNGDFVWMQGSDRHEVTEEEFNEFCDGNEEILLEILSDPDLPANKDLEANPLTHTSLYTAVKYENTYRTEPTTKFFPGRVSDIIRTQLEQKLNEVTYDAQLCGKLACELSDSIKDEVKQTLDLPRRKLVSFVTIGEQRYQGARVGSRCVWNEKADHYASASYKNLSLFAVGVVFAVFFE